LVDEVRARADRASLWTPVAFGGGAAIYLAPRREPQLWPLKLLTMILIGVALAARRWAPHRAMGVVCALMAVVAMGLCAAKLHSDMIAAPIVPNGLGVVPVEGWVVDVASPSDTGQRLLIAPVHIGGLSRDRLPLRVRLNSPQGASFGPGSPIRVVALLDPPPGPAAPGATLPATPGSTARAGWDWP
jgi:competence protein ComEC